MTNSTGRRLALAGHGLIACSLGVGFDAAHAQSAPPARSDNPTIVVTGQRTASTYTAPTSPAFGLATLKIEEIPQSVQVLTRDLIDDTGALSLADLLKNVPGASNSLPRSVPFGSGSTQIRGQNVAIFRDGLRNVDFADIDYSALNNIARVDVLKGPAGLVYGSGGPGGVIDIVTKRPLDRFALDARVTLGERSTLITSADVSVPLGHGFGARVTGEIERSESFIHFSNVERENFSGVLSYKSGGFDAAIVFEKLNNRDNKADVRVGLPVSGTIVNTGTLAIDRSTYLGEPAFDFTNSYGAMLSGYASYAFNDNFSISAAVRRTNVNFKQAEERTLGALNLTTLTVARTRARRLDLNEGQVNARVFAEGKFATGPVTHDLIVGYEYFNSDLSIKNFNVANAGVPAINVVNPVYQVLPFATTPAAPSVSTDQFNEIFVQDVARAGPVTVTGAVRQVWADFKDNTGLNAGLRETLYQLGGAVKLAETVSIFAGYSTGYNANSGIAATLSRTGTRFAPENYRQFEAGVKTTALAGVTGTISVFDLKRKGILVTDPVDAAFLIQVGEERSRGVEAELVWSPVPALSLRAGYLYLDAKVTADTNSARIGKRRPGAPEYQANAFASYTFAGGLLRNLRLSAGVTYSGDTFASLNNTIARPSFTVADFGASYSIDRVRIETFLSNAFDERYFLTRNDTQVNVGDPRLFKVRATVAF